MRRGLFPEIGCPGRVGVLRHQDVGLGERDTRAGVRNFPLDLCFGDLAAKALGGADGLDLCCVRAHQSDILHDKDSGKMAVAVLRLGLRRDGARRLVGLGNPAYSPHPAIVLKRDFPAKVRARGFHW